MKKIHLDLNHYSSDRDGGEAFLDDFYLLSMPRLIQAVYQSNNFRQYYAHMEDHTRQMMHIYSRMATMDYSWKDIITSETILAEVPYKRFFMDELVEGIQAIDSKAIIK